MAERGPVLLIDGRSGAGKSDLARLVTGRVPGAQLVRLDDVYPGWDGLAAGSAHVVAHVLDPVAPGWRAWDWAAEREGPWGPLDPARPLIVEGCGAASAAARQRAHLTVWVELDAGTRRRRALERDGDAYAPHWERWARQEDAFLAAEHPREGADLVVDGVDVAASVDLVVDRWLAPDG
ncbi:hypothetical protein CLV46_1433 [Diaminobutyricimonas aerilata]|uniref:Uridine kinase n=1 Tax=Diaminobutyricimonas aerilata TaxID=1162967 RepID=A0A2M9CJ12_9MICO|nr:ATP-binding protein [Diaminobutyricimonas aerilata]PJJ71879.1 hypothetical protein CLV46_1433 [Diaminobutyricimonas aerilata]